MGFKNSQSSHYLIIMYISTLIWIEYLFKNFNIILCEFLNCTSHSIQRKLFLRHLTLHVVLGIGIRFPLSIENRFRSTKLQTAPRCTFSSVQRMFENYRNDHLNGYFNKFATLCYVLVFQLVVYETMFRYAVLIKFECSL